MKSNKLLKMISGTYWQIDAETHFAPLNIIKVQSIVKLTPLGAQCYYATFLQSIWQYCHVYEIILFREQKWMTAQWC